MGHEGGSFRRNYTFWTAKNLYYFWEGNSWASLIRLPLQYWKNERIRMGDTWIPLEATVSRGTALFRALTVVKDSRIAKPEAPFGELNVRAEMDPGPHAVSPFGTGKRRPAQNI